MRNIIFRGKRLDNGEWVEGDYFRKYIYDRYDNGSLHHLIGWQVTDNDGEKFNDYEDVDPDTVGQYTGLQDNNSNARIFEGDLLSLSGTLIGNQYENEDLLKDRTNLLIEGLCTKEWIGTYQEAIKRGCVDAK